jgi:hypothetical protein
MEKCPQDHLEMERHYRVAESSLRRECPSKRWLGIELSFGSKLQETRPKGADGFSFLMVMAAIAFGYAGHE